MNFEVLKKSHLKRNIIIGVVVVAIIAAIVLQFTRAKYRVAQSMPLYNATVNYTPYDFKMVAMYQESDTGEYVSIDAMPSSGYVINEENSYCEIGGEKDTNAKLYTNDYGEHVIANLQKTSKCYLYFDEQKPLLADVIKGYNQSTRSDFSTTMTSSTTNTVYTATDDDGTTYYFAGNPTDNWVSFAKFYWRIIRVNGDGSIRLIYQGTSANTTGTGIQISTSTFNDSYNNNMYVGYMYTSGSVHGLGTSSTIKGVLDTWYSNNLSSYASYIDTNAGFCGDRTPYSGSGTGTTSTTYYAADNRLNTNKTPTFSCSNSSDLYTTSSSSKGNKALKNPIGLITADEVAYAGGVYRESNSSYYLYTGQAYWTMSPSIFLGSYYAFVFRVDSSGDLVGSSVNGAAGVRPVINLRADLTITSGNGTSTSPFILSL